MFESDDNNTTECVRTVPDVTVSYAGSCIKKGQAKFIIKCERLKRSRMERSEEAA